ncbi:hypothetical protein JC200_17560 [Alicyclobacillus sp. ALC3]|nr:hypothetical protein JC200_17560 [Alicyclobacillus sp. ALC3]
MQGLFGGYDEGNCARFLARVRSLVILADARGRRRIQAIIDAATEQGLPITEFDFCRDTALADVDRAGSFLRDQPIGTRVVMAVDEAVMKVLEPVLQHIGLTSEEVWVDAEGPETAPVFCVACYFQNPPTGQTYILCTQCSRILEVSDHYSPRLHAVMGYVSLPEQRGKAASRCVSRQADDQ